MPITGTEKVLGAALFGAVKAELTKAGSPLPSSDKSLQAFCDGIAAGLIPHLLLITVNPGIPTSGSPASQITVGPGTIS